MTKEEVLIVGGYSFKVKSLTIGEEPIWSSNAGRSSTGKMMGDIIRWVRTLNVTFCPMTEAQAQQFYRATHTRSYVVQYRDVGTKTMESVPCYGVPLNFPVYNYTTAFTFGEVSVNFVEE